MDREQEVVKAILKLSKIINIILEKVALLEEEMERLKKLTYYVEEDIPTDDPN